MIDAQKFSTLRVRKETALPVWTVFIDNPPTNALTAALLSDLQKVIDLFREDDHARAMTIAGEGTKFFCSGADINRIMAISSEEEAQFLASQGQMVCDAIEQSPKIILAAINGLCVGGGNEIAIACHYRIASENAKFSQPEVNLGIMPAFGATQRLPRLIGASKARKLMLTGDVINAQEALSLGLVDSIVSEDKLLSSADVLMKKFLRNSRVSTESLMEAVSASNRLDQTAGLKVEIECFKKICRSQDMKEGLRAFKERRLPNFRNSKTGD